MRHFKFIERDKYPVILLVPSIRTGEIQKAYITPHALNADEMMILDLHYSQEKKKTPVAEMKRYIQEELVPIFNEFGTEYILCTDPEYFKAFTKVSKVDVNLGYVMSTEYGPWKVVYVPNHRQIFYDPPKIKAKIEQALNAFKNHRQGSYQNPGNDIIKFAQYVYDPDDIEKWLNLFIRWDKPLTCDIEAFSLKHTTAGIGTITFCWSKHRGISFPVDLGPDPERVRALLKNFFEKFMAKLIYHSIHYDVYVLIYQLFMKDILDQEGLLYGLEVMLKNWDDTKLIAYLATNTCAENSLSLKDLAQEFSGNYALTDIKDITSIPLPDLLRYNLIDGLSTWYVREKYYGIMVKDQQLDIYNTLFKPAIKDIIQMQLTGMPVNMQRVQEVKEILQDHYDIALNKIMKSRIVEYATFRMNEAWVDMKNNTLKKKRVTLADAKEVFNPNSHLQLIDVLYVQIGLPVISVTNTKQPSTDHETLESLKNHTTDSDVLAFLDAMLDYGLVSKVLSTFIPALEGAVQGPDGWHYLFGNFNLGGTLSGRLSSSDPNLQNIPAKSFYGKLIKSCFQAPLGWIFAGLDFESLEDKISALTTKDPNKLKVYTDGYDGHSLRTYFYFKENLPGIIDTVLSINSIQELFPDPRQDSKAPTFALTYQGTYKTLMTNCGFSLEKALMVEKRYHELYEVSDKWVSDKLDMACKTGYITAAFGLRVRTPLLHQVVRGTSKTPYEAEAEGRSAGNALGQSWCLLNSRAWVEFMEKVRGSDFKTSIKPCAQIHDAGYAMIRDDIKTVMFMNKHLVKAVQWQEHPDIEHPDVKLGGKLVLFYPNWSKEIQIPNGASDRQIYDIIDTKMKKDAVQAYV